MDLEELLTTWEEVHKLGYKHSSNPNRFKLWEEEEKYKYDDTYILGTWKQPTAREKTHMRASSFWEKKSPPGSIERIAWKVNSQVSRIRTPKKEGGDGKSETVRNLLHIAYNLGGVGGIRQSPADQKAPPLKNYIELY